MDGRPDDLFPISTARDVEFPVKLSGRGLASKHKHFTEEQTIR